MVECPCDGCRLRARCAARLEACSAFAMFAAMYGKPRWSGSNPGQDSAIACQHSVRNAASHPSDWQSALTGWNWTLSRPLKTPRAAIATNAERPFLHVALRRRKKYLFLEATWRISVAQSAQAGLLMVIGHPISSPCSKPLVWANGSRNTRTVTDPEDVMERAVDRWAGVAWLVRPQPIGGVLATALLLSGCGGGGSSYSAPATPATYSIGGTITGLTAAGLVLANGSDTVSPAAGATSFTFVTALASGSNYAVSVKTQPKNGVCQVANGSGQVGSAAVTNVMVTCTRAWAWVSGSNTIGVKGMYGTQGMAAAGNVPGARNGSFSWIDSVGDLWLFGGTGYDSAGTQAVLNDLWRYSPGTGQWTWVSGSSTAGAKGVYGTLGMAAAGDVPGARTSGNSWSDSAGDLWLFGGLGIDSAGNSGALNDLWRYSPGTDQWTWVSGSSTVSTKGVYGTLGMAAAGNVPGARDGSVSWTDSSGALWLFGGDAFDSAGTQAINDLWRYSPGTGQWTWVSGSSMAGAKGVYGTLGMAAAGNVPGAREGSVSWTDSSGDLWLFGGFGYDSVGNYGFLNDLWRYSPGTGQWTWVSGSSTAAGAKGVYGTLGIAAVGNVPGGRTSSVSWTDSAGDLWLFGGRHGFSSLNDLWRYSVGTGEWTWVSGSSTVDAKGVYGTLGIAAAGNVPGARFASISWTDSAGDLWLFGGVGWDSAGAPGDLNDLWVY
jgi:N-acetylneuraminic acid mutarotase